MLADSGGSLLKESSAEASTHGQNDIYNVVITPLTRRRRGNRLVGINRLINLKLTVVRKQRELISVLLAVTKIRFGTISI